MKKLIIAGAALAALAGTMSTAFAQGAECEAGSAYGAKPGCSGSSISIITLPNSDRDPSGGNLGGYWGGAVAGAFAPYMLPDGRWVYPQANLPAYTYRPYAYRGRAGDIDGDGVRDRRDTDRDGDGVRNSRDRYPDDYRYR